MNKELWESKSGDEDNSPPPVASGVSQAAAKGAQIDDEVVKRYFSGEGAGSAAAVSMIAHEHNLPDGAVRYRLRQEVRTIDDWLSAVPVSARVLDVGCGAGAWVEIFAGRYQAVIGCEQSPLMVKAARGRLTSLTNAQIMECDVRSGLPDGPFDMVFLGGLCMYLNDADAVSLLQSLKDKLARRGAVILRESTVPQGGRSARGDYQAVYRSVTNYQSLFREAGFPTAEVRRNYAYTSMEIAENLVDIRRKRLPFLPENSLLLGAMTWWTLRGTALISFRALPRLLSRLQITWPSLQNHFFRLTPDG